MTPQDRYLYQQQNCYCGIQKAQLIVSFQKIVGSMFRRRKHCTEMPDQDRQRRSKSTTFRRLPLSAEKYRGNDSETKYFGHSRD